MGTKIILLALILLFPNIPFKAYDGGEITFAIPTHVSKIVFQENFTVFHDIKIGKQTWVALGFSCKGDTSITITDSKQNKLSLFLNSRQGVEANASIFIKNRDKPERVKGVFEWSWYNNILNISAKDNSMVSIIWKIPANPVTSYPPPYYPPPLTDIDPLNETDDIDTELIYTVYLNWLGYIFLGIRSIFLKLWKIFIENLK